ncbi:hypothetical protein LY76DRAFT_212496 [Colletotrichum caudatum]|nr:hypothetical protein LY76DRAFT_212496 [Colletotrichum caudatum]
MTDDISLEEKGDEVVLLRFTYRSSLSPPPPPPPGLLGKIGRNECFFFFLFFFLSFSVILTLGPKTCVWTRVRNACFGLAGSRLWGGKR